MKKLAVVALGGNALLRSGQKGTYEEQINNVTETCNSLANLIEKGYDIVIGHGNGPQVGNVMLQHEAGSKMFGVEAMPLEFCVAETQGSIGYMIEAALTNVLHQRSADRSVVTLVTEVEVDKNDPKFQDPTKPVGPYYTKEQADNVAVREGAVFAEDPKGRGWRKVVASPTPLRIRNVELVKKLASEGYVVITVGGGGIPVYVENGMMRGIDAVIDKDLASALTAVNIGAQELYILTDVPKVYINFRKKDEKALDRITVAEAEKYITEGHFSEGSMLPKVQAAVYFVKNGGRECVITEASELGSDTCGTRIVP